MGLQILGAGDGRLITHPSSEPIVCEALRRRLAMPCHKRLQAVPPFQQLWESNAAYVRHDEARRRAAQADGFEPRSGARIEAGDRAR